ncbi:hypothetical protein mRhiFer1_009481 [Rhinolophus ferrumequinum]|uniref:Uncharacterized protein n=1 Tax=Rhinolophus ferrumequinum TaxID=59479 RepID=A0A7J7REV1_RHIFE|nr:hypothetical protein mRhiFer1_009481 [Rhinolophus ferrumequinum]
MGLGQQREGILLHGPSFPPLKGIQRLALGLPLVRPGLGRATQGSSSLQPPAGRRGARQDKEPSASCCFHGDPGLSSLKSCSKAPQSLRSRATVSTPTGHTQAARWLILVLLWLKGIATLV